MDIPCFRNREYELESKNNGKYLHKHDYIVANWAVSEHTKVHGPRKVICDFLKRLIEKITLL